MSLPPPPLKLSAPLPPFKVSLPPPPLKVSAPPSPFKIFAPLFPIKILSRALPEPLISVDPLRLKFSTLLVSVKLTEEITLSVPSERFSVTVSLRLSTK